MSRKKLLSIILVGIFAISILAGCGNSGTAGTSDASTIQNTSTAAAGSTQEPYTVKIVAYGDGSSDASSAVAAELSKQTKKLFNTDIELVKGYTVDQLNLILTSGEKLDLFPIMPWELSLATLAANDQIVAMDDLLKSNGADTLAAISENDWKCAQVNGKVYGVPMNKDKAKDTGFAMSKDVADELGIDYKSLTSFDKVEQALLTVKAKKPDIYPFVSSMGQNDLILPYDDLGDSLGVLENSLDKSTKVVDLYETDSYKKFVEMMWKWGKEGLIMPDATSNTDGSTTVLGAKKGFGFFAHFKPGVDNQASAEAGVPIVHSTINQPYSTTSMVNAVWSIPANSEKPERAMQVLNLLYNDPTASNTFINGVEGTHYVYTDNTKKVIDYPSGKDANSIGFSVFGWACPNQQITPVRVGDPTDLWSQLNTYNANATASPAKGFTWNNAKVLNEVTACQNVISKYKNGLELGALNPSDALPKFINELKAAGIDTIVAEKQSQLDTWLAAQK